MRIALLLYVQYSEFLFSMDIGYMDDLISGSHSASKGGVHYLAADLIWNLPYKKRSVE
jgi:hypothetical protein